jgi:hypothetical protein
MRSFKLRFGVVVLLLLLTGSIAVLAMRGSYASVFISAGFKSSLENKINLGSYQSIHLGMTEEEVKQTLGVSYGQYFRGKAFITLPAGVMNRKGSGMFYGYKMKEADLFANVYRGDKLVCYDKAWIGDTLAIWITFDANGTVQRKAFERVEIDNNVSVISAPADDK